MTAREEANGVLGWDDDWLVMASVSLGRICTSVRQSRDTSCNKPRNAIMVILVSPEIHNTTEMSNSILRGNGEWRDGEI